MSMRNREYLDGHPNARLYELRYDDGEVYVFRQPGRDPVRTWDLASAVTWANHVTRRELTRLSVVDPETGAVLWVGEAVPR